MIGTKVASMILDSRQLNFYQVTSMALHIWHGSAARQIYPRKSTSQAVHWLAADVCASSALLGYSTVASRHIKAC